MKLVYKLTRKNFTTRNGMLWGDGVEHTAPGNGKMCGPAYIHAYRSPATAAFFSSLHGLHSHMLLWECDADIEIEETDKLGCTRVKTLRQMPLPTLTTEQWVRIAIRCVQLVCRDATWNAWANKWLGGEDRSEAAAWAAGAWSAGAAARDAAGSAAWAVWDVLLAARAARAVRNEAACAARDVSLAPAAWAEAARAEAAREAREAARNVVLYAALAACDAVREGAAMAAVHRIVEEEVQGS